MYSLGLLGTRHQPAEEATKVVRSLQYRMCTERLRILGLISQGKGKLRGDVQAGFNELMVVEETEPDYSWRHDAEGRVTAATGCIMENSSEVLRKNSPCEGTLEQGIRNLSDLHGHCASQLAI